MYYIEKYLKLKNMLIPYLTSGGKEHPWFKACANAAIKILLEKRVRISDNDSKGGYLSIFRPDPKSSPLMEYLISCGEISTGNRARNIGNSFEKAHRLNEFILIGHTTSRESENEANAERPGAVYFEEDSRIYSFDGLLPLWNEFISIFISCISDCLKKSRSSPLEDNFNKVPDVFRERFSIIEKEMLDTMLMMKTVDEVVALRPHMELATA